VGAKAFDGMMFVAAPNSNGLAITVIGRVADVSLWVADFIAAH
jgi:hypothetical protein